MKNSHTIKHLNIFGIRVDLFSIINNDIQSLKIEGAGDAFTFKNANKFDRLEAVYINSMHSNLNCEDLLDMPNLKEVVIINSTEVENVDAFLNATNLHSLELVNCKNAMTKEQKELFKKQEQRFNQLNINYA